ncbi:MAG: tetratricopeptide repeat protein [Deltaproteobacteria bacterium]|nr:tetratricopeptide repeat protein [Deltaproteobacteria bacterium]
MNASTHPTNVAPDESTEAVPAKTFEDEFLSVDALDGISRAAAERTLQRCLAEIEEMVREKRWEDVVSLFSPVEEKVPEVASRGLDMELQLKVAFAMGQLKRFDDAIQVLQTCAEREPENYSVNSALGYTAYNSLYAARSREVFLSGKARQDRVELAHRHLRKAQALRPDGVTNFYREGALFKQIEGKPDEAIPLLERAVLNWDGLRGEEKARRHQERKNFVKSLYNLAGALLQTGKADRAREALDRVLQEDRESNHLSPLFKYFALGKVLYHLNRFAEARDALVFALRGADGPTDFVHELLARTYLAMGQAEQALKVIQQVPERARRPYYRWTEADVWCALKDFQRAKRALLSSQERDRRSRHKTLIRLAKIEYLLGNFDGSAKCASEALRFFEEKWGTVFGDGLFWRALSLFRLCRREEALESALNLRRHHPGYPTTFCSRGLMRSHDGNERADTRDERPPSRCPGRNDQLRPDLPEDREGDHRWPEA